MKSLVESINLSLNEERMFKVKNVYKDFDDSLDALKWLEEDNEGPGLHCIANVSVNGKVGTLAFGKTINHGNYDMLSEPETLFLFANKLDGHQEDLTHDYETMRKVEFGDMVNKLINAFGN